MKKAYIYDKWYSSLGGGEVVASHLALTLHQLGYQTTIITRSTVSYDKIKSIQGLDLSAISFVESFNDQLYINKLTQDADIFINCSFWDYSTSLAKKNYYYCFFPGRLKNNLPKQILSTIIHPYEITPDNKYIFYNLRPSSTYTLKFSVMLPEFSRTNLYHSEVKLQNATIINRQVTIDHFKNKVSYCYAYRPLSNSVWFYSKYPVNLYHYPFQDKIFSLLRSGTLNNLKSQLTKFDKIIATSSYTQGWIKKYWNLATPIIYPPVPFIQSVSATKKNIITSVGRFFVAGHNKKQEIMVTAFRKLVDDGLKNWELHLAGGLNTEPESQKYAASLQEQSKNYPIYFHFSPPWSFIKKLYLRSKIYWHASGFGLDPNKHPERFEHFGITPVEAISVGNIPVVFNGGGLPEIITASGLDPSQHIYNTVDELVELTRNIIAKQIKIPSQTMASVRHKFSIQTFHTAIANLVTKNK